MPTIAVATIAEALDEALKVFPGSPADRLEVALARLRDYADAHGLDFGRIDRRAYQLYLIDRPEPESVPHLEGWGLFTSDTRGLTIQRDDEAAAFEDDAHACWWVFQQAYHGSRPHMDALAELCRENPEQAVACSLLAMVQR